MSHFSTELCGLTSGTGRAAGYNRRSCASGSPASDVQSPDGRVFTSTRGFRRRRCARTINSGLGAAGAARNWQDLPQVSHAVKSTGSHPRETHRGCSITRDKCSAEKRYVGVHTHRAAAGGLCCGLNASVHRPLLHKVGGCQTTVLSIYGQNRGKKKVICGGITLFSCLECDLFFFRLYSAQENVLKWSDTGVPEVFPHGTIPDP